MKRKCVSRLVSQVKRLQIEAEFNSFDIFGIETFIWLLESRSYCALACTSKSTNNFLIPFQDSKGPPKRRAIRLAHEYRKLYEDQISQKSYDAFAWKLFTEQEFIDFGLGELTPNDRKMYVSRMLEISRNRTSILECLDRSADIVARLDSLKETKLPSQLMELPYPTPYSIRIELAFQGQSPYHITTCAIGDDTNSPVFSNWKSLDEIDLNSFIEYQRNVVVPSPSLWKTGRKILDMIYNQPGFKVLSVIKRWRGDFINFVDHCRIDYTQNDFIKLELDVKKFMRAEDLRFAREPPLWVWQTLFPHKDLTQVPLHLQGLIIPGGLVDNYFK